MSSTLFEEILLMVVQTNNASAPTRSKVRAAVAELSPQACTP
jgi:hypothetical protein